jgi:DNA-binding Lrp family transcriptional regulator
MMNMDVLDKMIIKQLLENSRASYHSIARMFNVTCPTITYRVNRLRQIGVIQRFIAELSHKTMGVEWVIAEIKTEGGISKTDLLQTFESNACIEDVFMLARNRYIILSEVYQEEKDAFVRCLKKLDKIDYIEISDVHPISTLRNDMKCKYTTSGEGISLSPHEVDVLRFLAIDARIPTKTITDSTGYNSKLVRKIIRKFIRCTGVHLTLKLDLSQCGHINFILHTRLQDMNVKPEEITDWIASRYAHEHWFSLFAPRADNLLHYLTVPQASDIEHIIREVIKHPRIEDVEATIIYSMFKSPGRTRSYLRECDGNFLPEELQLPSFPQEEYLSPQMRF